MEKKSSRQSTLVLTLPTLLLLIAAIAFAPGSSLSRAESARPAADTEAVELLENGDFSSGFASWWTTSSVTPGVNDGVLHATVTQGGTNPWDAIVGQHGIPVQVGGTYTLSFEAWASAPVPVTVLLQEDGGAYTQYFNAPLDLDTSPERYTFTFTGTVDDPAATFQFQIGGRGEFDFYLSGVSLLGPAPPAPPSTGELIRNGGFDSGLGPWWTTDSVRPDTSTGELAATVLLPGTNPWDAIVGQHNIPLQAGAAYTLTLQARADREVTVPLMLQENGGAYSQYFSAPLPLTTETRSFTFPFTAEADDPEATFQFHLGGQGSMVIYLDNISLQGPPLDEAPEEPLPSVRLNQTGYLPGAPKRATIAATETAPLPWTLYDGSGTAVASGMTSVFGYNEASDEHVHVADFSDYTTPGEGYSLEVKGERSHRFDIREDLYERMKYDALAYFYHNRSGIPITMPYAGEERWTRPAGHLPDLATCFDQVDTNGKQWQGCDYTLDVSGGWYDAGDHGKYVVNGGISVWTMLNQYERARTTPAAHRSSSARRSPFADGTMNIPENQNGVPDILDEARWQLEFLLSMQVPAGGVVEGELLEGMVHHKVHDVAWTGLPTAPHDDPMTRYLYPPSTAATLNLAATGAQCARIWRTIDVTLARRCLQAAERAWEAALAHPDLHAANNFTGGGPYDDRRVSDEFYWAAAELFITTGRAEYRKFLQESPHYLEVPAPLGGQPTSMSWGETAALGTLSLAVVPNALPTRERQEARQRVVEAADSYIDLMAGEGYGIPFTTGDSGYPWGSNSFILNNMLIMALAYDFTSDPLYREAVGESMDYLLGRNPMDQSYVSGYGERPLQNPHHRFWARQANADYPPPPPGAISGGPNSGLEDPYAQTILPGCAPQRCFVDHIDSWSTNEITINWNAPFAWLTAFLDESYE